MMTRGVGREIGPEHVVDMTNFLMGCKPYTHMSTDRQCLGVIFFNAQRAPGTIPSNKNLTSPDHRADVGPFLGDVRIRNIFLRSWSNHALIPSSYLSPSAGMDCRRADADTKGVSGIPGAG